MGLFGLKMGMASTDALACTYAALILHGDGIPITDDKISAIIKAAGIEYEAYWPGLFATMLKDKNVEDLLMASASAGAAPAAAGGGGGGGKKAPEPEPEDEDDDMGMSLFD